MCFYRGDSLFGISAKHNPYQPDSGFPTASADEKVPQSGFYGAGRFSYTSKNVQTQTTGSNDD